MEKGLWQPEVKQSIFLTPVANSDTRIQETRGEPIHNKGNQQSRLGLKMLEGPEIIF